MADDRVPLALLPGMCCDAALWAHQLHSLSDIANCRVPDFAAHRSVQAMAQVVLDEMPPRFALAGLSMGGYVSFEIIRQAPQRIERLALLDTKAGPDTKSDISRRRGLIELAAKGTFKGVTRQFLETYVHESRLDEPALADAVMTMAERVGRDGFLNQQQAVLDRPDSLPDLSAISCPVLVLCGRQDRATPLHCHEEMAREISGANLVVVEDCGHLAPMERPQEVAAALRSWLKSN